MMRALAKGVLTCLCLALLPGAVYAQATIQGVVKDTSGAVLPGVTVEASSPVLIEKTRSTVTDGSGQYQIINLLPGTYTVTFTLSGFNVFKRDGIELNGSFVATLNADMKVGAIAETITVTGQTPLVDVRSAAVQKVVTKEIVDTVPTGRLGINLAALQPGIILGAGGSVGGANTNSLTSQDVGGTAGDTFTDLAIHGGKPAEQRQTIGGLSAATTIRFGESLSSSPSFTAMQEMSVNTSGADASLAGGGVQINYVPRDGGNTFKGLMFYSGASGAMQGTNYTTGTRDASGNCTPAESMFCRGLVTQPGALKTVYDINPGFGGPILKDKLWWFATARWTKAENYVPNNYPNRNFVVGQTNPTLLNTATMSYVPEQSQPLYTTLGGGGYFWEQTARLSWQMDQKNKFGFYYNNKKREYTNALNGTAHEALNTTYFFPFSDNLVQWSAPQTNRLLLEAGFWRHQETWGGRRAATDIADPLAVGVTDNNPQSTVPGYTQLINNYHGRVGATDTPSHNPNYRGNFAASYVTGSHSFKTGIDLNGAFRWSNNLSVVPYSYVVSTLASNGVGVGIPVPQSLSLRSDGCTDPLVRQVNGGLVGGDTTIHDCPTPALGSPNKVTSEGGIFAQDKWTINRLTLSGGIRMDWFFSENPAFHLGPSLLTPLRNYDVPKFSTTRYKDWTPKAAMAYDLFGDGKTALKVNVGKYVLGQALVLGGLASQAGYNIQLTSSRTWIDNNNNFIPDCDLTRNTNQGPAPGQEPQIDTCLAAVGPNANFYSNTLFPNLAVQDDARYGWGKRPYSWELSTSAQHEIGRGVSVNGGVFWRWFGNFLVTDNTSATVENFTEFSVNPSVIPTAPSQSGGQQLPSDINTAHFYNLNPGVPVTNLQGLSKTMFPGSNVYDHWFGFDLGLNARLPQGIIFQGGLSTGHQTTDYCDVQDPAKAGTKALVEMLGASSLNTCHMDQNWLPQVKFLGSYTVPKIDVQIGASFQSIPGVEYAANYAAANSTTPDPTNAANIGLSRPVSQGGLGRLPSGGAATGTTTLSLIQPGSLYGSRFNQIDARFGKVVRFAQRRAVVSLDLFNVLNADTIALASSTYATWLAPQAVVAPRLMKVSLTFDF
ncbi:MAG TPA: carboxypeptidase-like regulatory domain-containing protein [Vicinamibacterales bacterium]|nr:carboxypeptidase-like regulatory domain-containing protein [Vicinamibacterales bacterium]